jgi:hypothetical protein
MKVTRIDEGLYQVDPSQRVLLLSHCLRPSQTCPGKFDKKGLVCPEDCSENCVIKRLKEAALRTGYKGMCVAAGGAMALRFVKEHSPKGIVAVACNKELSEGVEGVKEMTNDKQEVPAILIVPLISDGCVDTEVDEEQALKAITLGCSL